MKFVGAGRNHINTVYVGNVASLVSKVIGNSACFNQSYNLTDKNQVEIKRFVDDICENLDLPKVKRTVPLHTALGITLIFENIYRLLKIKKPPPFTRKKITFMARDRKINSEKAYALMGDDYYSYSNGIVKTLNCYKP